MLARTLLAVALLLAPASAKAQSSQSALTGLITSTFPDNTSGLITPLGTRTFLNSFVLSTTCSTTGQIVVWGALGIPACSAQPTLGANGGTGGALTLNGSTSGSVTARVAAAAGTGTIFQYPNTNGSANQYLVTDGSGNTSWSPNTHLPNPGNFYVTTAGSDSNNCTSPATPCLTIQGAVDKALSYDWLNTGVTINVGTGTFTKGFLVTGTPVGAARGTGGGTNGVALTISGNGSALTALAVTDCASGVSGTGVFAGNGANVVVTAISITNGCSIINLWADNATIQTGSDVKLGTNAGTNFAHARATNNGQILINTSIGVSGNATNAFAASTQSKIIFVSGTITYTGGPTIGAGLNAIDNSSIIIATAVLWSGTFTGSKFSLALGGMIDTEQTTTVLPGSLLGSVGTASVYYTDAGQTCVGGAVGCPVATAPTGLGGAGTAAILAGSSHRSGVVVLTAAVGAAATGVVHVSPAANLSGQTAGAAFCIAGLADSATGWNAAAGVHAFFTPSTTAPDISISWFNGGAALVNGSSYAITYICE